jgi:hypothetical protein
MVRVCEDTHINPKSNKAGFYMDDVLKSIIDDWLKNITNDWDFCLIISGGGMVRVGKSVLAMQIAYYWVHELKRLYNIDVPFTIKDNIIFNGEKLIETGNKLGEKYHYSPIVFDEAGADLESMKVLRRTTQNVKDFLRECGQYNFLTILVIPEFFDLPNGIATNRSEALLNVKYYPDKLGLRERGFFDAYSKETKKKLYLYGKKEKNYHAQNPTFHGRFYNNYALDEEEYRNAKAEALKSREKITAKSDRYRIIACGLTKLCYDLGKDSVDIADYLKKIGIIISSRSILRFKDYDKATNIVEIGYEDNLIDVDAPTNAEEDEE